MNLLLIKKLYNFPEQDRHRVITEVNFENAGPCHHRIYMYFQYALKKKGIYTHTYFKVYIIYSDECYIEWKRKE